MLAFLRLYAFELKKRKKQQLSKGVKKKSVGLVAVKYNNSDIFNN